MSLKVASLQSAAERWQQHASPIVVGKDLLELLSSSMYVDLMTIYREYVQNAADSVDEARNIGLLSAESGRVDIFIDNDSRTIRLRDNGKGISQYKFQERLTAFGASSKRGTRARGFRGVGRLAGLGYCQELLFRSRAAGETHVSEMRWNCKSIKMMLRAGDAYLTLQDIVNSSIDIRTIDGKGMPDHFFEVELRGIVRHKNDSLLNITAIYDYLSQVAPVPFSPDFKFGEEITASLSDHVALGDLNVQIHGLKEPVYRPHRNEIAAKDATFDEITGIEIHSIPSQDGSVGAVAWFLHHGYKGALPTPQIRGLRLRSGNIQVGGHDLLQDVFVETRFNSWSIGEIHTVDSRIIPNGRRDHYEQNVHFNNLINHVSPITRQISIRCRKSSVLRNLLRDFQRRQNLAQEKLNVIKQGSLAPTPRKMLVREVEELLKEMRRTAARDSIKSELKLSLNVAVRKLEKVLESVRHNNKPAKALAELPVRKRRTYEEIFALIYDCSANQTNAHILVDRILSKLG